MTTTPVIVEVAGANIGRDDTPQWEAHTEKAFQLLRHAGGRTPAPGVRRRARVALVQEMNDDDRAPEWTYAHHTFPANGWTWWPRKGQGSLVPVACPADWEGHPTARVHRLSDGKAGVTPTRFMTVRVSRVPGLPAPIGWASFQLVAGAWTNPGQTAEAWRRDEWHQGAQAVETALAKYRAAGITVVGSCDSNRPGAWDFNLGGFQRIVTHGLDMLWTVEGRSTKTHQAVKVDVRRTSVVPMPIDGHSLLVATVALT